MAKPKTIYECSSCGEKHVKWSGQCQGQGCRAWNTLTEVVLEANTPLEASRKGFEGYSTRSKPLPLSEIDTSKSANAVSTGIGELDVVMGNAMQKGAVIVLGGFPGAGKSTLLLQCLNSITSTGKEALMASGEESAGQIASRAKRLGCGQGAVTIYAENNIERVLEHASKQKPSVIVVDSIQTAYTADLSSAPGSVVQVRECAARYTRFAKSTGTIVFLTSHINKENGLAGPKTLEHVSDVQLVLRGEPGSRYRFIHATKNRFGSIEESAILAMTESGLVEIANPSGLFMQRVDEDSFGSVVVATHETQKPLLVEIQALLDKSGSPNPRRLTVGLESQRLSMILAVLNNHSGLEAHSHDVYASAIGGIKLRETGVDLAIAVAIMSASVKVPVSQDIVVFGEITLNGGVVGIQNSVQRLKEVQKLGFKKAIIPHGNANAIKELKGDMEIRTVKSVAEALKMAIGDL